MEQDEEGSEEEADDYCLSICMRKDDYELEDELEYFRDVPHPPDTDEGEEDRWWSPEPQGLRSEEEDEEENRYFVSLLMSEPNGEGAVSPQKETETGLGGEDRQAATEEPERKGEGSPGNSHNEEPPAARKLKRRGFRKRRTPNQNEEWETAWHDAWLRELLTDSSEGEPEDGYSRFVGSGRWIAEMAGDRGRGLCRQEGKEGTRD
jgi:hypothetical protein